MCIHAMLSMTVILKGYLAANAGFVANKFKAKAPLMHIDDNKFCAYV